VWVEVNQHPYRCLVQRLICITTVLSNLDISTKNILSLLPSVLELLDEMP
jgi:hypothetical protein